MNARTAKTLVLEVIGGTRSGYEIGRTILQKKVYFIADELGLDMGYRAHLFGPYSRIVDYARRDLVALGFVREQHWHSEDSLQTGEDLMQFNEELTEDGKAVLGNTQSEDPETSENINRFLAIIDDHAGIARNANLLSKMAKIHYIITQIMTEGPRAIYISEFPSLAQEYDWEIEDNDVDEAMQFLSDLGCFTKSEEKAEQP